MIAITNSRQARVMQDYIAPVLELHAFLEELRWQLSGLDGLLGSLRRLPDLERHSGVVDAIDAAKQRLAQAIPHVEFALDTAILSMRNALDVFRQNDQPLPQVFFEMH
eukprot:s4911_g2.t1